MTPKLVFCNLFSLDCGDGQFDDSGLDNLSGIDQEDNSMLSSNQSQPGILTLALNELFESVRQREIDENKVYIIRCSYFEIYND